MPTLKYALVRNGPKRLEISHPPGMQRAIVLLDGKKIGMIDGQAALTEGRDFDLPDGSRLFVQLISIMLVPRIRVLRNGQPLPGSVSDPAKRLENAYGVLFLTAIFNLGIGLFMLDSYQDLGISQSSGWFMVGTGVVFVVLGFAARSGFRAALTLGTLLYMFDIPLIVCSLFYQISVLGLGIIAFRGFLLVLLIRGFGAMDRLDETDTHWQAQKLSGQRISQRLRQLTILEKGLFVGIGVLVLMAGGVLVTSRIIWPGSENADGRRLITRTPPPTPTPDYFQAEIHGPDDSVETITIRPLIPVAVPGINMPDMVRYEQEIPGDLAWNMPTYSISATPGRPFQATSGIGSGWESSLTHDMLYVDLGSPQKIHQILIRDEIKDIAFDDMLTYYVVSDDLITWRVVMTETKSGREYKIANARTNLRILTLRLDVTARYVGVYAKYWGSYGDGKIISFSVIAAGYEYSQDSLLEVVPWLSLE